MCLYVCTWQGFDPNSAFFTKVVNKKKKPTVPTPAGGGRRKSDDEAEELDPRTLRSRQLASKFCHCQVLHTALIYLQVHSVIVRYCLLRSYTCKYILSLSGIARSAHLHASTFCHCRVSLSSQQLASSFCNCRVSHAALVR